MIVATRQKHKALCSSMALVTDMANNHGEGICPVCQQWQAELDKTGYCQEPACKVKRGVTFTRKVTM